MKNWIQEMIERESLPKASRVGTVDDFCAEYGISQATYYYQASKKENERQIIRNAVKLARKGLPEVLEKLREKAESGDSKSTEMFLKYVAELSEHLDLTSKGEKVEAFNFISNPNKDDSRHKTDNKTGGSVEEATG